MTDADHMRRPRRGDGVSDDVREAAFDAVEVMWEAAKRERCREPFATFLRESADRLLEALRRETEPQKPTKGATPEYRLYIRRREDNE